MNIQFPLNLYHGLFQEIYDCSVFCAYLVPGWTEGHENEKKYREERKRMEGEGQEEGMGNVGQSYGKGKKM